MKLESFVYDKKNGENPRKRFVMIAGENSVSLDGYEVGDNQYKNFLKSRMSKRLNHGVYDENVLKASKIISMDDVFKLLNWDKSSLTVFKELGANSEQLAKLVYSKSGKTVLPLDQENFLLLSNTEANLNVDVPTGRLTIRVKEGSVEFLDSDGGKLSVLGFSRKLLGL